jgi:hypothetical protein
MESEQIEVPVGTRFSELLGLLAGRHEAVFHRLVVDNNGRLLPSILPCVDDEQISLEDNPVLTSGSSVTFLSAISGG